MKKRDATSPSTGCYGAGSRLPSPMLESSRRRIVEQLDDSAILLDVGGWADPLARADWVIDLMPYATRGLYERCGWVAPRGETATERFTADTWVQRDLCAREAYPFEDDSVDFVVCSHTLEDLRDPVWVCSEMNRIARAGYIEVPSRLEEQSWGVMDMPGVGWAHHRWLIDIHDGAIEFALKLHGLHTRSDHHFPAGFWNGLDEEQRVQSLLWEGGFVYRERIFTDEAETDRYLRDGVATGLAAHPLPRDLASRARRLRQRAGRRLMKA